MESALSFAQCDLRDAHMLCRIVAPRCLPAYTCEARRVGADEICGTIGRAGQNRKTRWERNPDGSLIPLAVRRKPSDQLVLKMLSSHFPKTYGERVELQHTGIIPVMKIGQDGKMRPNSASMPKLENQSDELVVAADSVSADPAQMKSGMVVYERCETSEEIEAREAAMLSSPASIEFRDEDVS